MLRFIICKDVFRKFFKFSRRFLYFSLGFLSEICALIAYYNNLFLFTSLFWLADCALCNKDWYLITECPRACSTGRSFLFKTKSQLLTIWTVVTLGCNSSGFGMSRLRQRCTFVFPVSLVLSCCRVPKLTFRDMKKFDWRLPLN